MEIWQTGNIGCHNIRKWKGNPSEGFSMYELAKQFLQDSFANGLLIDYYIFCVMKLYFK